MTIVKPVIIVHGGAKTISENDVAANQAGCRAAIEAGWAVLIQGGSAAGAVEAAIRVLESDQTFNAGFGATLNSEGEVEVDAAMMEGATLGWGAVAAVQGVRHPIVVARKIMEEKPRLLVARSGERFARNHAVEICAKEALVSEEQYQEWKEEIEVLDRPNTVGCVALDADGNLVAGTSTGGTTGQPQGRVGDTALVGCGLYADNQLGACSTTGDGESIIPVVLAKTAIDALKDKHPDAAAQWAIDTLISRVEGEAGCILIDRQGRIGWAHNSPDMAVAYMSEDLVQPAIFTRKDQTLVQSL
ncbi:isoaspartyl peptidase/L-asparaginase family protein [Leptolyngbya boryana CZ1]|jgi:beta-aspartyl-peptidase (threonine type)|uniref:Peptidase T2 asparaginase 2 n=2 Tax=Leptolyngbya boryana TaxID=1184 RepID=A0A1Z4JQR9_LEPBY|nr:MULTISPECIES: isoaspartyl peptidase/L-asparaginase family protein [Leptolyngbya]BAY59049.1 peptidase T2 asparaginase 2 [Leptolyngbya boryana NIES-2135]MBD2368202.1 isoaspartyl peptidase/L-asparaginase [Leptolyngbya sp. FACHB-161]MBD2374760.1 isoaspartyl peptidase/L-asparaginase [Leptolyngbya sp. FACHB-238]MBD2399182.1 isoaspartyl peptidase/L-asparaginase [Leptolyngbya sp. FACHB-239]MBD2405188.1 isoaspartyl peptidase/L-asparaginase [Leptolyngbya sp. FACHB-402]